MGKVYEALSRSHNEADEIELFEDVEQENEDAPEEESSIEKFNFMRYSLGGTAIVAKDRPGTGRSASALAPRSLTKPGRELTVSTDRVDPHLVAINNFDPHASREYNKLALSLISKAAQKGFKRVLVASAQTGEGRTCVTLNLACALARARQRVLVVDCDLLNPAVMRRLGLYCDTGMREALERGMPPGAAVVAIRPYGFNVLPTIKPLENTAELFAAPGFWKMLQSFDADYDFILFDSSPLATGGDSSLLVRFADTTLMVVRAGQTSAEQMASAISPLTQDDILGVVINRAN